QPEIYDHTHNTVATGGEIIAKIPLSSRQNIIVGSELTNDIIVSPVLGDHTVTKYALIFEYGGTIRNNFIFNAGLRGDYQSNYSLGWYPTLSAGYWFSKNFKLRSSVGRCFRVPTFTELYYNSPSNIGNPDLKPEKGWSYEIGSDFFLSEKISMQANIFYRKQSEIIDWISENNGSLWNAENVGRVDIKGFEQKTAFTIDNKNRIQITYSYTESDFKKEFNYLSKYVFRYPVHQFSFLTQNNLPYGISGSIGMSLKKRKNESAYNIVNVRLDKKFRKNTYHFKIMNVFNMPYHELIGVPAPGRWFSTGMTLEL
ncbi:TonB-dependent receptor, partial [bacterium]|nr:TonB-dependent receptor [bacterium]